VASFTGVSDRTVAKYKYDCAVCGLWFTTSHDHMVHYLREHDRGLRPREERTRRPVSCWVCVTQIPINEEGRYVCPECGFLIPEKDPVTRTFVITEAQTNPVLTESD